LREITRVLKYILQLRYNRKIMSVEGVQGLSKDRLDQVIEAISRALSSPDLRRLSQRAIQARVWHQEPVVALYMSDLRRDEEILRGLIMKRAELEGKSDWIWEHFLESLRSRREVTGSRGLRTLTAVSKKNKHKEPRWIGKNCNVRSNTSDSGRGD
jgi:hypothetical protein